MDKAASNGMDVFRIFDALNDIRNIRHSVQAVRRNGKHAQGTISYTTSPLHTTETFVEMAERLVELGCDSICIKDMAALLRPQAAYDVVKGIKTRCGEGVRIHIHTHATTGVTLVSLMKAIEAGADCLDTAISSLSLGPGHNPTESLVAMLVDTGYETRLDKAALHRIKNHFATIRPRYQAFLSNIVGVETDIFDSQIPGTVPFSAPDRLCGYPIQINNDVAVMAASAKSIAFGDFSFYTIRDVMDINMFRFTDSAYAKLGQVGFLAWMRSGGQFVDVGGSVKLFVNAAS